MSKKNQLICHIMDNLNNEVDTVKTRTHKQEFTWKKRIWAIPDIIDKDKAIITDKKGVSHLFVDVNQADGIIRMLEPQKSNIIDDKCTKCGDKISIDAISVRNLVKRNTIKTFWGIDNSFILLLLIMGIMAMGMMAGLFYFIGENQTLASELAKYKPQVAKFIIGLFI